MSDLLAMLQAAALEAGNAKPWDDEGAEVFRRHHSQLMYQVPSSTDFQRNRCAPSDFSLNYIGSSCQHMS